ncbi:MAG: L-rhamnose catabolism isomerase [Bacteroidetes bacterium]|nr:L-rhamnose catabolism isomerase [Rhodothermaceae bacterium RA]RMH56925.1 MAG: L-rhamnose catabolism isomerase [Bacteroidota bacterium]
MLDLSFVSDQNRSLQASHQRDFEVLADRLDRRGVKAEAVVAQLRRFEVAVPSWALGTGGTRFGRFPGPGEPRDVFEKMEDIGVIQQLTRATPRVSLHIPWDEPDDPQALKDHAATLGLGFDAVNSNTFQDQPGQALSYKFGSLCHTDPAVRNQAIEHNLHVIQVGRQLGSNAITIWLADGSNYPGQMHLRKSFERTLDGLRRIYAALPPDWRLFTEHKPFEPAFYATVVQDWGTSFLLASQLGKQAACLVDLGHHLPNTNVELVVARLISAGKLGGFHFNDNAYGDDDLTAGSIRPYRLFLIFNELVDAEEDRVLPSPPAYMIDQSHNLKDPIEALLQTVDALQRAYAQALIVDRRALAGFQQANDVLMAEQTLQQAFRTDVTPLVAEARRRAGGALDPIRAFRASGYRAQKAAQRASGAYVPPQSL